MKRILYFLTLALFLASNLPAQGQENKKPWNILWITCEDMSPDLGCFGAPGAITPNLDKLASQGVRFTRAFTVAGVCAPSRSAIITGMYPTSIGTHHMRCKGVPPAFVRCYPEFLRLLGYYCTNNVKTDYNFDAPLTAWDESSNKAHWRNRRRKDQPFFAVFNFTITHESQIRTPAKTFAKVTSKLKSEDRHDPAKAILPPYYPDTPVVRNDWARYQDLITAMDIEVGELLRQLAEDGLAENTIVLFNSDHGRGLPRAKRWIYDSGIHVPLIVRWPGQIPGGTTNDNLVSALDFAPTFISLAGGKAPAHMQGQVFLGPKTAKPRDYIFAIRDRMDEKYDRIRACRDKDFLYIKNFEPKIPYAQNIAYMDAMPTMQEWRRLNALGQLKGPSALFFEPEKPEEELFDVKADPHNINNLAKSASHQEVLLRMRKTLEKWQKETGDLGSIPEDQLWEKVRPGGKYAVTQAATIAPNGGPFKEGMKIKLACPTEGASLAYTTDAGPNATWLLYGGEITLERPATVRVRACRLGYKDSAEVMAEFSAGK